MRPAERRIKKIKVRTPGGNITHQAPAKKRKAKACGFSGKEVFGKRTNRAHKNLTSKVSRELLKQKVISYDK
ncbi:MAG: hypothetical protein GOV00_01045 [Candidatus Altiarchaeota archaeon]|nr:hypothetical protein [Candidatus Altiarchaeota archaeon]